MIPLLVIAAWSLLVALIAGLCAAARVGDLQSLTTVSPRAAGETSSPHDERVAA